MSPNNISQIPSTILGSLQTVAVVIPTFNEVENIPVLFKRIFELAIPGLIVILVDDGSPDGTGTLANGLATKYEGKVEVIQRGRKQGLGTAYIEGFSRALAKGAICVIQMDADLSHKPEYLPYFLKELEEVDVVVGSRYIEGGGMDENWSLSRKILSTLGNFGIRLITGLNVKDVTSGFKGFRRDVLTSINLQAMECYGFGFQAEVAHACQAKNFRVREHPILFSDRVAGHSKMSARIILEALWHLFLLRWRTW